MKENHSKEREREKSTQLYVIVYYGYKNCIKYCLEAMFNP